MARTGQPSRERIAALGRALSILDVLAESGELGTNELARRIGTTPSTVSRQLGSLVEARLVEHAAGTGRYRLGLRVVELAAAVLGQLDVRAVARPYLQSLVDAVDETVTLSAPGEHDAVTVDFVRSRQYVQGATRLGRPSIGHATAAGKVMLAFTGSSPALPLVRYTERTIVDPAALERELARVRKRGFAEAFEERERDLNAVAAPVWASGGDLAAIVSVHGPARRFDRAAARRALPLLLERCGEISRLLGAGVRPQT